MTESLSFSNVYLVIWCRRSLWNHPSRLRPGACCSCWWLGPCLQGSCTGWPSGKRGPRGNMWQFPKSHRTARSADTSWIHTVCVKKADKRSKYKLTKHWVHVSSCNWCSGAHMPKEWIQTVTNKDSLLLILEQRSFQEEREKKRSLNEGQFYYRCVRHRTLQQSRLL